MAYTFGTEDEVNKAECNELRREDDSDEDVPVDAWSF